MRINWQSLLIGLAAFCASGYLTYTYFQEKADYSDFERWPSTAGTPLEFDVVERTKKKSRSKSYIVKLKYSYSANGETHTSDRINFGPNKSFSTLNEATDYAASLVGPDNKFKVYYNPNNPSVALLNPSSIKSDDNSIAQFAIIAFAFLAGVYAMSITFYRDPVPKGDIAH